MLLLIYGFTAINFLLNIVYALSQGFLKFLTFASLYTWEIFIWLLGYKIGIQIKHLLNQSVGMVWALETSEPALLQQGRATKQFYKLGTKHSHTNTSWWEPFTFRLSQCLILNIWLVHIQRPFTVAKFSLSPVLGTTYTSHKVLWPTLWSWL